MAHPCPPLRFVHCVAQSRDRTSVQPWCHRQRSHHSAAFRRRALSVIRPLFILGYVAHGVQLPQRQVHPVPQQQCTCFLWHDSRQMCGIPRPTSKHAIVDPMSADMRPHRPRFYIHCASRFARFVAARSVRSASCPCGVPFMPPA